jgi:hypothetical protein
MNKKRMLSRNTTPALSEVLFWFVSNYQFVKPPPSKSIINRCLKFYNKKNEYCKITFLASLLFLLVVLVPWPVKSNNVKVKGFPGGTHLS